MSTCYQCGSFGGSDTELCEECHLRRYHREQYEVIKPEPDTPLEGLEWSPQTRGAILSGGAVVYLSLLAFCVFVSARHLHFPSHISADGRFEFVASGDSVSAVREFHEGGAVAVGGEQRKVL
jgi:hypothetical protein